MQKHIAKWIRHRCHKLHVGLSRPGGEIVFADRTHDNVGNRSAPPSFRDPMDDLAVDFLADDAYGGAPLGIF